MSLHYTRDATNVALDGLVARLVTCGLAPNEWSQACSVLSALPPTLDNSAQSLSEDCHTNAWVVSAGVPLHGFDIVCLKLRDRKRKREGEAIHLQGQIGDALLSGETAGVLNTYRI